MTWSSVPQPKVCRSSLHGTHDLTCFGVATVEEIRLTTWDVKNIKKPVNSNGINYLSNWCRISSINSMMLDDLKLTLLQNFKHRTSSSFKCNLVICQRDDFQHKFGWYLILPETQSFQQIIIQSGVANKYKSTTLSSDLLLFSVTSSNFLLLCRKSHYKQQPRHQNPWKIVPQLKSFREFDRLYRKSINGSYLLLVIHGFHPPFDMSIIKNNNIIHYKNNCILIIITSGTVSNWWVYPEESRWQWESDFLR